jgi:hypothetical protein
MRHGKCKTCGLEIGWCKTKSGKWMPVDIEKVEGGNLLVHGRWVTVVKPGEGTHQSHFVTCGKK